LYSAEIAEGIKFSRWCS